MRPPIKRRRISQAIDAPSHDIGQAESESDGDYDYDHMDVIEVASKAQSPSHLLDVVSTVCGSSPDSALAIGSVNASTERPLAESSLESETDIAGPLAGSSLESWSSMQNVLESSMQSSNEVVSEAPAIPELHLADSSHPASEAPLDQNVESAEQWCDVVSLPSDSDSEVQFIREDREAPFTIEDRGSTDVSAPASPRLMLRNLRYPGRQQLSDPLETICEYNHRDLIPSLEALQSIWPACIILHTFLITSSDFGEVYTYSTSGAMAHKLRVASGIIEENEQWLAEVVVVRNDSEMLSAGSLPPVASAIIEACLMAPDLNFMTSIDIKTPSDSDLVAIPWPPTYSDLQPGSDGSGLNVPITIRIHCDRGGELIGFLLSERRWAQYIRHFFKGRRRDIPRVTAFIPSLSGSHYCTNLFAKDCVISFLTPRPEGSKVPNLDFVFSDDRETEAQGRTEEQELVASYRQGFREVDYPAIGTGWSGLPRGVETFRAPYMAEPICVFEAFSEQILKRPAIYARDPDSRTLLVEDESETSSQDASYDLFGILDPAVFRSQEQANQRSGGMFGQGDEDDLPLSYFGEDAPQVTGGSRGQTGMINSMRDRWGSPNANVSPDRRDRGSKVVESVSHEEIQSRIQDLLASRDFDSMPECRPHVFGLKVPLMPHQRKGVQWMTDQEKAFDINASFNSEGKYLYWEKEPKCPDSVRNAITGARHAASNLPTPRGGVLADDMGLGKTVQSLALILKDEEVERKIRRHQADFFTIGGRRQHVVRPNSRNASPAELEETPEMAGTLVICPVSVLSAWQTIIRQHTLIPEDYVAEYHGSARSKYTDDDLKRMVIVLTTYGLLLNRRGSCESPLHRLRWKRIILDEAHTIRNHQSATTKAVLALQAERKWCLTGTPIQNRLSDLLPLFAFIKAYPFDSEATFKTAFGTGDKPSQTNHDGIKLALASVMLRRTKELAAHQEANCPSSEESLTTPSTDDDRTESLSPAAAAVGTIAALPPKTIHILTIELRPPEMKAYQALAGLAHSIMRQNPEVSYFAIYALMTHLRLLANSEELLRGDVRSLITKICEGQMTDKAREALIRDLIGSKQMETLLAGEADGNDCPICCEPNSDTLTKCKHMFHKDCLLQWFRDSARPCPVCRTMLDERSIVDTSVAREYETKASIKDEELAEPEKPVERPNESTKVQAVCDRIFRQIAEGKGTTKIVLFSSFVRLLKHLEQALQSRGIKTIMFTGELSNKARHKRVQMLKDVSHPVVFLASTKAAGQGLTLTSAHIVYIFDPWWNPHAEDQAIDRIHRIGQNRAVEVYKVISKHTIEEQVLLKQKDKRDLASRALLGGSVSGHQTMTREEMRNLLTQGPSSRNESGRTGTARNLDSLSVEDDSDID
eukprot:Blabericola_migrator_1__5719@NODE_28_length_19984_cov_212_654667_g25_i0_p1_GENE_NODE_28_length_19984_cov_212_654667_g25_i0NODE_28_length_19984_cov_212_654667_g25_i0_p1_ORF_typecomplete_len1386_score194_69SNF2_N/PF00176_23/3e58Helicase_C/PF00271_31/6_6e15zfC3HC4/PF00097_25/2_3e08zfC3HC4_2/PF13923_6/5e08zfRING_2/PF13639_6/4_2e03zfRING_2/PF13639_6/6_4e08zfC3HC4_3/PF13920_6/4e07ResIII/PF04851_15/7_5e07zfrbx1/PF12678_7/6_9e06zfANAPC11/PF12861_7/5_5e06zfRING_5/PF14634_6/2_1e05ProkRING_4/PF14447_6/6_3e